MQSPTIRRWLLAALAMALSPISAFADTVESYVYIRNASGKFEQECTISIRHTSKGWAIVSETGRPKQQMRLATSYDAKNQPLHAQVALTQGEVLQQASVTFNSGKAIVKRTDHPPCEFDAPKATIVTSAPDWTDLFLLCRNYDRIRKGNQEYPALWIHPTQQPLRLKFSIEHKGSDTIEHNGKKVVLGRYTIRIRNNSAYVAWADADGRMIRLMPTTASAATAGLTLQGYEQSAAKLRTTL